MLRTVNDAPTLWDALLPAELLVLPVERARPNARSKVALGREPIDPGFERGRPKTSRTDGNVVLPDDQCDGHLMGE